MSNKVKTAMAAMTVQQSCLLMRVLVLQGVYSPTTFQMLQLPKEWYNALEWQYPPHQVPC